MHNFVVCLLVLREHSRAIALRYLATSDQQDKSNIDSFRRTTLGYHRTVLSLTARLSENWKVDK